MKRAIVFANGNLSDVFRAKKTITKDDYIIGVDGGTEYVMKAGLVPHVIIGDFDSLPAPVQKKLSKRIITKIGYPRKKDKTDFELAIEFAVKKKYKEVVIFGLLGDRLDHLLANIFFLEKIFQKKHSPKIKIIEGNQGAFFVNKEIILHGNPGDIVSIIPLDGRIKNIKLHGLEYRLKDKPLLFGSTRGVSNVMVKKTAKIIVKKGVILVVHLRFPANLQ